MFRLKDINRRSGDLFEWFTERSERIPVVCRAAFRKRLYHYMTAHRSFIDIRDHALYKLLYEQGDIHRLERDQVWLVTGFRLADQILQDKDVFVKVRQTQQLDRFNMFQLAPPEEHERMQRFLMAAFTKRMLAEDAAYISELSLSIFDALPVDRPFDLHRKFSVIISYHSVCRFLGIETTSVRSALRECTPPFIDLSFPDHFTEWLRALLLERETGDPERFINVLRRTIREGIYTPEEAYELLNNVWNGFMGTTPIMLTLIFEQVTSQRQTASSIEMSDESWVFRLTDEVIRMRPVIMKIIRKATRDVVLDGISVKAGDRLLIDLRAVNRDIRHFPMPYDFSVEENRQRHLSFGAGAHRCMGMQMARHSARFILSPLVDRFRSLKYIHAEWMDMETPLTFIHYPQQTRYQIYSDRK